MILGSMDIVKWFPNTLTRPSAKVIKMMIIDSGLEFEGMNYDAVSRYLAEYMSDEEIEQEMFQEIVYRRNPNVKSKKGKVRDIKLNKYYKKFTILTMDLDVFQVQLQ